MRFQRVLFIVPNLKGFYSSPGYPLPGTGYLIASLEAAGVECDVLDMYLSYGPSDLDARVKSFQPDLVGVTVYSYRRTAAFGLVHRIKNVHSLPVVIGGPHVSLVGAEALVESGADFAVRHEGEYPLTALCTGSPLSEIAGLLYFQDGQVREREHAFIEDLDRLPFPTYRPFDLSRYQSRINVVSSRGCPYQCIYCSVKSTMGRGFRARSPRSVVEELRYWYERGRREFNFLDDTFAQSKDRVYQLCDLIESEGLRGLELGCTQGIRANRVDRPLLKRMREVGFRYIGVGVESASNRILRTIRKGQTIEQVGQAIEAACDLDYRVRLFFMVGLPEETPEDLEESFAFATRYPVQQAMFYNIIPYPGTDLFRWIEQNGRFLVDPAVYLNDVNTRVNMPFFETPTLSLAERKQALKRAVSVSRRVQRNYRVWQWRSLGVAGRAAAWLASTGPGIALVEKMKSSSIVPRALSVMRRQRQQGRSRSAGCA
ncbi:MAG: radical SAM protein [Chloroflexi bacterium]|nr:radical SAM protein [Chloroflexota bacterium]